MAIASVPRTASIGKLCSVADVRDTELRNAALEAASQ
jgi:hypothetical protein